MSSFLADALIALSQWARDSEKITGFLTGGNQQWLEGLFAVVVMLVISFSLGKTKIILAWLATYLALVLEQFFPWTDFLTQLLAERLTNWTILLVRLFLLIIFGLSAWLALNRSILRPKMSLKEVSPLLMVFLSLVQTGFWLSLFSFYWTQKAPQPLPMVLEKYFGGSILTFFWLLLPLLAIALIKRSRMTTNSKV